MLVLAERYCTRNTHVKYQSSSTHCSKVISRVKVYNRSHNHRQTGQWRPESALHVSWRIAFEVYKTTGWAHFLVTVLAVGLSVLIFITKITWYGHMITIFYLLFQRDIIHHMNKHYKER